MRLLKRKNRAFLGISSGKFVLKEFSADETPKYAILSHTWGKQDDEISFEDIMRGTGRGKPGFEKLKFCEEQATRDGLLYFWIDTCCIDRQNSSELQEAINSMFRWYHDAAKCYVYLSDVSLPANAQDRILSSWESAFESSRWFTRGWTLQELLAPRSVEFFSKEGRRIGNKQSQIDCIHKITGIATAALRGSPLSDFNVDERMSWAAKRETKREEDTAYALLGIFDIHMPLIYGEGQKNAFIRLRKEISGSLTSASRSLNRHDPSEGSYTSKCAFEPDPCVEPNPPTKDNADQIQTHHSFNSWLSQFSESSPTESTKTSIFKRSSHEQDSLYDTVAYQSAGDSLKLPVAAGETRMLILISGLKRLTEIMTKTIEQYSIVVSCGLKTRLDEMILALNAKGYAHIEGFYCRKSGIGCGPMLEIEHPIPVQVVSGASQHHIDRGPLQINENEPFQEFYEAVIGNRPVHISLPPVGPSLSIPAAKWISVECGGVGIKISLMRTLRVPDDGKVYQLPDEFNSFPLFNISQFEDNLPEGMMARGGLFIPMYQREAMWVSFDFSHHGPLSRRVAIRLLVGGVNAISGEVEHQKSKDVPEEIQDYLIVPGQRWLDGFRSNKETVRQFVAMPLGQSYSVEKQLTGEEFIGGIQLEILQEQLPQLQQKAEDIALHTYWSSGYEHSLSLQEMKEGTTPLDSGMKSGDSFDLPKKVLDIVKYYYPVYQSNWEAIKNCWGSTKKNKRAALIGDFFSRADSRGTNLDLIAIQNIYSLNLVFKVRAAKDMSVSQSLVTFLETRINFSPFMFVTDFINLLAEMTTFPVMAPALAITIGNKPLDPTSVGHKTIFDLGVTDLDTVSVVCPWTTQDFHRGPPRIPPTDPIRTGVVTGTSFTGPPPRWQMAVAAGGLINQKIFRDPVQPPYSGWDVTSKRMFNIQILNSVAFESVTGLPIPSTPISTQTYFAQGIPFFKYYEEISLEEEVTGIGDNIKSVSQIDEDLVARNEIVPSKRVNPTTATAGCTTCLPLRKTGEVHLCEIIVRPCNHAVCSKCYEVKNDPIYGSYENQCPVCSMRAMAAVKFSSPMGIAGTEKRLGFALQDVQLVNLN